MRIVLDVFGTNVLVYALTRVAPIEHQVIEGLNIALIAVSRRIIEPDAERFLPGQVANTVGAALERHN